MSTIFDSSATTNAWTNFWSSASAATDIAEFSFFLMADPYLYEWHFETSSNALFATEKSIHGYQRGKLQQPHIIGKIKPHKHYSSRRMQFNIMARGFEHERVR